MAVKERDGLKLVVVGHVDHGKSTVIGRLLHDTNSLPQGTIDKVKKIAKDTGKPFEYAYLLDAFEEEQKQGITIDTTQIQFQSENRDYTIIDAPGHKEFLKNMISGAANAEAAFLIIDAKEGVQEQSKRHAYMLSLLGIKKVYIIINKMDLVDYSKEVYEQLKAQMVAFLNGFSVYPIDAIPISAYYGENILTHSDKLSWFEGYSVIEAMDHIEKDVGLEEKPLRFPIQDVYKFDDRRIIVGRIESGNLKAGDEITIYPEGKKTKVKTLEYWGGNPKEQFFAGESVGITVEDEFFNKRGEVIAIEETKPFLSNSFRANLFWLGKNDLVKGKKYKIKLATQEVEGEVEEILKVVDATSLSSNETVQKIAQNDVAEVIITTNETLAFDRFTDSNVTGRFVIVDEYDVAGGGIIASAEIKKENCKNKTFYYQSIQAHGEIFEEFFYQAQNLSIYKSIVPEVTYTVGDEIPVKGKSYAYPEIFDIVILRDKAAVKIRNKVITEVLSLEQYTYGNVPIVNGRGFGIKVASKEEWSAFLNAYQQTNKSGEAEFLNNWSSFDQYRKVIFA